MYTHKKTVSLVSFFSLFGLLGMTGCARYRARRLPRLESGIHKDDKKPFIALSYQVFDTYDCKTYLDRNVIAEGYQPILISFVNNSERRFRISKDSFNLPCVHPELVAEKCRTSTATRAAGYGFAALFVWPLIIPAVVDGLGSSRANAALDTDFEQKGLRYQMVGAFGETNGLVFVPLHNFREDFTLTVIDPDNHERFILSPIRSRINV